MHAYHHSSFFAEITEHPNIASDSTHERKLSLQRIQRDSDGSDEEKVSLESNNNPKNGIVFINGYGGKVRFNYRFDNDPFVSTGPVQPTDWTLGPEVPFAKRNFTVIAVDDVSNEIISATTYPSGEISSILLFDVPLVQKFAINIVPDPFTSYLFFLNFNDPVTSPYRYLYIDGNFKGDVSTHLYNGYLLTSTKDQTTTESFTNIYYQLCNSSINTNNCQSFQSPYLGALEPAESVWVVFSPVRQFQFTSYNPSPVVTPIFINSYYNISSNVGFENASQLVFEFGYQIFNPEDLRHYQDENSLPHTNLTGDYFGGIDIQNLCVIYPVLCAQANLDVQLITSLSQYPTKTSLFYESNSTNYGFAVAWIQYLANLTEPPLVISVSYNQDESSFQPTLIELFNLEAMKVR